VRQFGDKNGDLFPPAWGVDSPYLYILTDRDKGYRVHANGHIEEIFTNDYLENYEFKESQFLLLDLCEKLGFYIPSIKCICESHLLAQQGCKCGAFQRELASEGKI